MNTIHPMKFLVLILLIFFSSCNHKDHLQILKDSLVIFDEKQSNLQSLLMKTIQEQGLEEAVSVCNIKMKSSPNDSNPRVRRISDLNRNALNVPTDSEMKIIQKWKSEINLGNEIEPLIFEEADFHIVMKPIVIQNPTCLNCHGTDIPSGLKSKIRDRKSVV